MGRNLTPEPVATGSAETRIGQLRWREYGGSREAAGERTLLFVHGLLTNSDVWGEVIQNLSQDFRCITLDIPLGSHTIPAREDAALNVAELAQAVMGGGQHVRISMDEVRALDSETARLLHQRLCGWIDPGKTGKASIDTLCGYVWPSEASGSTMRKRRQRVREALPELVALGWTVTEFAAGKYDITRPKAAG